MKARHRKSLPRLWLVTDERIDDAALLAAAARLSRGAAVLFRHYGLEGQARRALYERIRQVCRKRGVQLILAGSPTQAMAWKADGFHGRQRGRHPRLIHSAPAHDAREIRSAEASGADIILLSPVFPTRSHPGAATLGRRRFAALVGQTRLPAIALGGMAAPRWPGVRSSGAYGWAAIDGLVG